MSERRASVLAWQIAVGVTTLGLWQALVSLKLLDPFFVSRPSDILRRIATWISAGTLWPHLIVTLEESLLGLLVGAVLGIGLGFAFARSPLVARVFDPYIKMLNAIPRWCAPLFLLWFGLGIWSKVALAVTLVFFVMFFSTISVRDASQVLIDNVRMLARASGASSPRAGAEALTDLLEPAHQPRFAMVGAVGSIWGRRADSATDLAGRGDVRHDRRLCRHDDLGAVVGSSAPASPTGAMVAAVETR